MRDYTGHRVGKLIIVDRFDKIKNGRKITKLKAKCDCGSEHIFDQRNLNKTNSCGCSKLRKSNQVYINKVFKTYKGNAKRKGHDFELQFDELIEMTQQKCYYCGCKPSTNWKLADDGFEFKYNGIDRVNNSEGYVKENVVSCCKICNAMKSNLSTDEFLEHIQKIYSRFFKFGL